MLFIIRELDTDRFHKYADRIFALKCDDPWIPGAKMYHCKYGSGEYLKNNISRVEDFCRISNAGAQKIVVNNQEYFTKPGFIAASGNFFSFFSFTLLTNNPESVLAADNNIVLSEDLAKKYFGSDQAVGQVIKIVNRNTGEEMVVTGIFRKPVDNSQLDFEMVRLIKDVDSRCYVRLASNTDRQAVEKIMEENKGTIPVINTGIPGPYYLEPFLETYFNEAHGSIVEASRSITDLWIALIVGLMIIGVAVFNYAGLLNNNLAGKEKELLIRRIHGGTRLSLLADLAAENSILILISFLLSIFFIQEMLPLFNNLTGSKITESFLFRPEKLALLFTTTLVLILITSVFVLFRLRSFTSLQAMNASQTHILSRSHTPLFTIFQLTCSMVLIICSFVIVRQTRFISRKQIGLDKNVIEVKLPDQHSGKAKTFRDELITFPAVKNVSVVGASPVLEHFLLSLTYTQDGVEKQYSPSGFSGDKNYIRTLGIELLEGSDFSGTGIADRGECLVNQTFARLFNGQSLIGRSVPGMENMVISGIVEDFNYSDLKSKVGPAFISCSDKGGHLMVKASPGKEKEAANAISDVWKGLIPDYPVNIESIGDRFEWFHRDIKNYIRLIGSCALISIFLAMIGLFSVSYQRSRLRTKEIGIRKINGAEITEIIGLLYRDFLRWIIISFIIACPVAWYAMHKWLQSYVYKTEITWWIFLLAGVVATSIVLATVSWQSFMAANRNPVEALRYE